MAYQPFAFKPGISRKSTAYANEGRWYDGNRVRFREGFPEIIGGWQSRELIGDDILGVCRTKLTWRSNNEFIYEALGSSAGLFLLTGGSVVDITPAANSFESATDPLSVTSGSNVLTIEAAAHGSAVGSRVDLTGFDLTAAGIDDATLNTDHVITAVPTANTVEVELGQSATSTVSGGGGTGGIDFLIAPGTEDAVQSTGWGAGGYGEETYGTPREDATVGINPRVWSLDTFGEILVGTYRGGTPVKWDPTNDGTTERASFIPNAPMADLLRVTSPDRHLVLFSTVLPNDSDVNRLAVRWSSQEDYTDWTPTATNTSGSQLLSQGSQIVAAEQVTRETLIWTDVGLTAMQFIGAPFVFGFTPLEGASEIVSRNAVVEANGTVMWMGLGSFYVYDGVARVLNCAVKDKVFQDINLTQRSKFFGVTNKRFQEVWWFYCSEASQDIDRYVMMNYESGWWSYGALARTVMEDAGINDLPSAVDQGNIVYDHETGYSADGAALDAFVESAPMDISEGDNMMYVRGLVPDARVEGAGNMEIVLGGRRYPESSTTVSNTYTIEPDTERVRTRMRVRQVTFRYQSSETELFWQGGKPRLDLKPQGRY